MWISAQSRPEEVFKDHMTFFSFDNPLWALNLSTCNRENKCACVLTVFFLLLDIAVMVVNDVLKCWAPLTNAIIFIYKSLGIWIFYICK